MQKYLKRICISCLALIIMMMGITLDASAASPETTGAVKNEFTYEEAVFISGEPVVFKGTSKDIKITQKEGQGKITETFNMKLTASGGDTLSRSVSYESDVTNYTTLGQKTANGVVKKYS